MERDQRQKSDALSKVEGRMKKLVVVRDEWLEILYAHH